MNYCKIWQNMAEYICCLKDLLAFKHICYNTYNIYKVNYISTRYMPNVVITPYLDLSSTINQIIDVQIDNNIISLHTNDIIPITNTIIPINNTTTIPIFKNLVELNCINIKDNIDHIIINLTCLKILKLTIFQCVSNEVLKTLTQLTDLHTGFNVIKSYVLNHLTNLVTLNCGFDSFTDNDIRCLTKLTTLVCGESKFTSIFSNQLTYLDCGKSNFNDEEISQCLELNTLICGYNNKISDNSITKLTKLRILDCGYKTSITEKSIIKLNNLSVLHCRNKQINPNLLIKLTELYHENNTLNVSMPNLIALCYNNNQLGDAELVSMTKLKLLHFNSCTQFTDYSLCKLNNLTNLECGKCNFTDDSVKLLTNLVKLNCGEAALTDITLKGLKKLKYLVTGINCIFTDVGLTGIQSISYIDCMYGTHFTDIGVKNLKYLQEINIYSDTLLTYRAFIRKYTVITVYYESDLINYSKFPKYKMNKYPNIILFII